MVSELSRQVFDYSQIWQNLYAMVRVMSGAILRKFEQNQVFTESESWMLFRLAAIAEACGWSLLISGILWAHFSLPGDRIPVLIAGQIHGLLFLMYALASIGLYPNLKWSRKRAFVALIASAPPYGSLIFEQWAQRKRQNSYFRISSRCVLLAYLTEEA